LKSAAMIMTGKVLHSRRSPVEHTFQYPVYMYRLDLDDLESLSSQKLLGLFGYNKLRPVSVWDKDYLFEQSGTIKERLFSLLRKTGVNCEAIKCVELVTGARFFNYVFNPVNFYYCYDASGEILGHVVEINNTYHQRHPYVLFNGERKNGNVIYRGAKEFFVSPFNRVEGNYEYVFSLDHSLVDVKIDLLLEGGKPLITRLWGKVTPLNSGSLLKTLLKFPLGAILTMPRILWQAQILRFKKNMPLLDPPAPMSPKTKDLKS